MVCHAFLYLPLLFQRASKVLEESKPGKGVAHNSHFILYINSKGFLLFCPAVFKGILFSFYKGKILIEYFLKYFYIC